MFFLGNIQVYITFYTYWFQAIKFFMVWSNFPCTIFKWIIWEPSFHIHYYYVCFLHLTMSWKKEINTKKSISTFFGLYLKSNYAVLWSLYINDRIRTPLAFISLQPTCGDRIVIGSRASQTDTESPTTQSDRELNAVCLKHRHRNANGSFSGRIWSPTERYLIGLDHRFTKCWLAICSHYVAIRSHRSLLGRHRSANWS